MHSASVSHGGNASPAADQRSTRLDMPRLGPTAGATACCLLPQFRSRNPRHNRWYAANTAAITVHTARNLSSSGVINR